MSSINLVYRQIILSDNVAYRLTAASSSFQQGEQPPLEKMKPSRSRNLEEALSETDTLVRRVCVCVMMDPDLKVGTFWSSQLLRSV